MPCPLAALVITEYYRILPNAFYDHFQGWCLLLAPRNIRSKDSRLGPARNDLLWRNHHVPTVLHSHPPRSGPTRGPAPCKRAYYVCQAGGEEVQRRGEGECFGGGCVQQSLKHGVGRDGK